MNFKNARLFLHVGKCSVVFLKKWHVMWTATESQKNCTNGGEGGPLQEEHGDWSQLQEDSFGSRYVQDRHCQFQHIQLLLFSGVMGPHRSGKSKFPKNLCCCREEEYGPSAAAQNEDGLLVPLRVVSM